MLKTLSNDLSSFTSFNTLGETEYCLVFFFLGALVPLWGFILA